MFDLGMTKFVALLQFLLALGGCSLGGTTYSNRIAEGGHDVLASRARVQVSSDTSSSSWAASCSGSRSVMP